MTKTVPQSERKHIIFAGRRNAGKSSLMNKFIGQDLSIVSSSPGTTTDPVKKSMELLPFGPVVLVDTAGIDDEGGEYDGEEGEVEAFPIPSPPPPPPFNIIIPL